MSLSEIYNACVRCKGTGIAHTLKGIEDPCTLCNGEQYVEKVMFADLSAITSKLDAIETKIDDTKSVVDDILDKCDDILDKCNDIFEQVSE